MMERPVITDLEMAVLALVQSGMTRTQIAQQLGRPRTHVNKACGRLAKKGQITLRKRKASRSSFCSECGIEVHFGATRCKSCVAKQRSILGSRWTCIEDPEHLFTGRTVKDFGQTLKAGYWPPGSIWVAAGDRQVYRVVECKTQRLEPAF